MGWNHQLEKIWSGNFPLYCVCHSAIAFLRGKSNPTSQNPPPKSSHKISPGTIYRRFSKGILTSQAIPKMSVGDLAEGVPEGVPWLGFAGLGFKFDGFWGTFLCQKKMVHWKKEPTNSLKFQVKFQKGCFFLFWKAEWSSLQQIMKFQKGVLFKHIVHWKKWSTNESWSLKLGGWPKGCFFPKSLRLKTSFLPM